MRELTDLGAVELSALIRRRQVTCVEVMHACLARVHALNPTLNALVALRPDEALLTEAEAADAQVPRGWLHGLPIAIKDLAETAGIATTWGSSLHAGHIPSRDCDMVRRIKMAGAIVIGKTNTPEFGLGSHTYNPVYGTTVNPYDRRLSAGGSSGGAAAALAARLLPVADGSDMMGSLRNPAAFCNIYGFRPSIGLLPQEPVPTEWEPFTLATHGPMGRTIDDIAALLDTLANPSDDSADHALGEGAFQQAVRAIESRSSPGLRIGWLGDLEGQIPTEPGVIDLCRDALAALESTGAQIEPVDVLTPPSSACDFPELFDAWTVLRSRRIAWDFQTAVHCPDTWSRLKPELRWEIERGLALSSDDMHRAITSNRRWRQSLQHLFERFDLLCLPSASVFPFDAARHWPTRVGERSMGTYHEWMSVVIPASLQGLPSLAVPAGFDSRGLPAGMQLMGPRGADALVLQAGQRYHHLTDWPQRQPPSLADL